MQLHGGEGRGGHVSQRPRCMGGKAWRLEQVCAHTDSTSPLSF